ncbi:MAG: WGR domain-containing protein [Cytophagales bacterium]|nr:WGR domain-containing protein [Cytophagales bacterium]
MNTRRSSKFREITQQDTEIITRYGKIGTKGKQSFKRFDTEEETESLRIGGVFVQERD